MTSTVTMKAIPSIQTVDLGGDLVAILWENGQIDIEHWKYSYSFDPTLTHVRLDTDQARALRDFLHHTLA